MGSNPALHQAHPIVAGAAHEPVGIPTPGYFGPYLRYGNVDYNTRVWSGSILVITQTPQPCVVTLTPTPAVAQPINFTSVVIDTYLQYTFHRFDIFLHMNEQPVVWRYSINVEPGRFYEFHVAAVTEKQWRFAFHSCNGFSASIKPEEREKMGGVGALWKDVLAVHKTRGSEFHAMLGGGDQIYGDPIWKALPSLQHWLGLKGKENRQNYPWSPQLEHEVSNFYFNLYTSHFNTPNLKEALASIPTIFQIDDHDIFDGYGSYPDYLQFSNYFQNIGRIAWHFYYVFQQHTTKALLAGPHAFERICPPDQKTMHFIKLLGPSVAVVGPDTRGERSRTQILSPQSYDVIFDNLSRLPPTVKHVVWMLAVPIVYPRLVMPETFLNHLGKTKSSANKAVNDLGKGIGSLAGGTGRFLGKFGVKGVYDNAMGSVKKGLGKSGLMSGLISAFGEVDLLDDMIDHWTHPAHAEERTAFVIRLQNYAATYRRRVHFISGDVHCAGVGKFYTAGMQEPADPALMYQIIASAIVNVPPPKAVLKLVHNSAKRIDFSGAVKEEMVDLFQNDVNGQSLADKKLIGRRNWGLCRIAAVGDGLQYEIRVESDKSVGACVPYGPINVPPIM
ncbi:hypothetical protein DFJ77DRAFT_427281 [Powellomyces hirtus]|nr:hypothetical protein DFJ77DRAFT_427281 [Powellomyces hirtus]